LPGLIGSGSQFKNQLIALVVTMALSAIVSIVALKVIDAVVDLTQHDEKAYND
jgi:ammonia channel protein AmtB